MEHLCNLNLNNLKANFTKPYYVLKHQKEKIRYINIPFSIDIETTSTTTPEGKEIAFPYLYQIGLNHQAYYTRDYEEFYAFIDKFNDWLECEGVHIHCLIHNLSFEFTFFSGFIAFTDVFAKKHSQPVVATYRNMRFLDSYLISGYNLDNLAKNFCTTKKMVGDIDFRVYRTPSTPLTTQELKYAENDVIILNEYWDNYIDKNYIHAKGFTVIPLTNTAKVRMLVRDYIPNKFALNKILEPIYPSARTWALLERCFQGGIVKSNPKLTNILLHFVHSFDLTSSYPAAIFKYLYPVTKFHQCNVESFESRDRDYLYIFKLHIKSAKSIKNMRIMSFSKCYDMRGTHTIDNGRIIYAEDFYYYCTCKDLEYLVQFYDLDYSIEYAERSKAGRLPHYLIDALVDLYKKKNDLKVKTKQHPNDSDLAADYLNTKGMLNSLYGMMVTKEHLSNWTCEDGVWQESPNAKYHQLKFNDFLLYQWGVFVTSYARACLLDAFLITNDDVIYGDTDSCKFLHLEKYQAAFDNWNIQNDLLVQEACNYYGVDYSDMEGIGRYDYEGCYTDFKTLGSKRYYHDGEVTISGISNKAYTSYCSMMGYDPLDFFEDGAHIPAEYSMKNTVKYFTDNTEPIWYTYYDEIGNAKQLPIYNYIHISDAPWSMSLSSEYDELLIKYAIRRCWQIDESNR